MRNKITGKHEVYKHFKRTGQTFVGVGDTKEEAQADLKRQLEPFKKVHPGTKNPYYVLPLEPTGETVRSPGYVLKKDAKGRAHFVFDENNTAAVFANPDLAKFLREANGPVKE